MQLLDALTRLFRGVLHEHRHALIGTLKSMQHQEVVSEQNSR